MNRDARSKETANRRPVRDIALLMTGVVAGCGIALLFAPSSGEELRHTIGRSYRKATKKARRYTEDLRDRADDLLEHAHELRELGSKLLHRGGGHKVA